MITFIVSYFVVVIVIVLGEIQCRSLYMCRV